MCSGLRVKPNIVAHIKSAADARRWEQIAAARIGSPGHRKSEEEEEEEEEEEVKPKSTTETRRHGENLLG
jgi:hypothetical protein